MRHGVRSILTPIPMLVIIVLSLSCGPRKQSGNPGTVGTAQGNQVPTQTEMPPLESPEPPDSTLPQTPNSSVQKRPASLPRLVDLGAGKCIPCKMMVPILDELKRDYSDQFTVDVIDVWKDPAPGRTYSIRVIPTQIFFDPEGEELWRHEGFMGKEDILNKWAELGVPIEPPRG